MRAVWQEPEQTERQGLFRDLISEAETGERVLILFGLLKNTLTDLAQETEPQRIKAGANRALSVINFLREGLGHTSDDPFHGAFKRFYNHMHRQIIDALRDKRPEAFATIAASIATLTSDDNASAFVGHCIEQSELREHRLAFALERLFAANCAPLLRDRNPVAEAKAFSPLRLA